MQPYEAPKTLREADSQMHKQHDGFQSMSNLHSDNVVFQDFLHTLPPTMPDPNGIVSPSDLHLSAIQYSSDPGVDVSGSPSKYLDLSSPVKSSVKDGQEVVYEAAGDVIQGHAVAECDYMGSGVGDVCYQHENVQLSASPMFIASIPPPTADENLVEDVVEKSEHVKEQTILEASEEISKEVVKFTAVECGPELPESTSSEANDAHLDAVATEGFPLEADVKIAGVFIGTGEGSSRYSQHEKINESVEGTQNQVSANKNVNDSNVSKLADYTATTNGVTSNHKERKSIYEIPDSEDDLSTPATSPVKPAQDRSGEQRRCPLDATIDCEFTAEDAQQVCSAIDDPQTLSQVQNLAIKQAVPTMLQRIGLHFTESSSNDAVVMSSKSTKKTTSTSSSPNAKTTDPTQLLTMTDVCETTTNAGKVVDMADADDQGAFLPPSEAADDHNASKISNGVQITSKRALSTDKMSLVGRRRSGRRTSIPTSDRSMSQEDLKKDGTAKKAANNTTPSQRSRSMNIVPRSTLSSSIDATSPIVHAPSVGRRHSGRQKSVPDGFASRYVPWQDLKQDVTVKKSVTSTPIPEPQAEIIFQELSHGPRKRCRKSRGEKSNGSVKRFADMDSEQPVSDAPRQDANEVVSKELPKAPARTRSGRGSAAQRSVTSATLESKAEKDTHGGDEPMPDVMLPLNDTELCHDSDHGILKVGTTSEPNSMGTDKPTAGNTLTLLAVSTPAAIETLNKDTVNAISEMVDSNAMEVDVVNKSKKRKSNGTPEEPSSKPASVALKMVSNNLVHAKQEAQTRLPAPVSSSPHEKVPEKEAIFAELKAIKMVRVPYL